MSTLKQIIMVALMVWYGDAYSDTKHPYDRISGNH